MVLIYSDNLKDRREAFLIPGGGYGRTKCVRSSLGGAWLAVPEQPVCREEPSEEARVTLRGGCRSRRCALALSRDPKPPAHPLSSLGFCPTPFLPARCLQTLRMESGF